MSRVLYSFIQVAKKSLIAAQINQDSSNVKKEGRLQEVAKLLDDQNMKLMASDLENLLVDADRMQYPTQQQYLNVPHDLYTEETAHRALTQAMEIFERANRLIYGVL